MTIRRLSYAPGYSRSPLARARRKAQIEAATHIQIDGNDTVSRTRVNVGETDKPLELNFIGGAVRPFEINLPDGTKLTHAAGTKVITITRGSEFVVTDLTPEPTSSRQG
jgi:hypothetical protein